MEMMYNKAQDRVCLESGKKNDAHVGFKTF